MEKLGYSQKYFERKNRCGDSIRSRFKKHGPHLPLSADLIQAEYFKNKIEQQANVVIAPTVTYSFYPLFLQFAGSTSVSYTTGRDMILEIVRSLAGYGVRRFYIINIGISTIPPLTEARNILLNEGIVLSFNFLNMAPYAAIEKSIKKMETGTHADELETGNLLLMRPELVDMKKALDDTSAKERKISWSSTPNPNGNYTKSGIFGYATLATKEKGKLNAAAFVKQMLIDIDSVRNCNLPQAKDLSKELAAFAGIYRADDGKEPVLTPKTYYIDYSWNKVDHSDFYRLNSYGSDRFGSQMLDVLFVRNESNEVTKAWINFRGQAMWVTKQ